MVLVADIADDIADIMEIVVIKETFRDCFLSSCKRGGKKSRMAEQKFCFNICPDPSALQLFCSIWAAVILFFCIPCVKTIKARVNRNSDLCLWIKPASGRAADRGPHPVGWTWVMPVKPGEMSWPLQPPWENNQCGNFPIPLPVSTCTQLSHKLNAVIPVLSPGWKIAIILKAN